MSRYSIALCSILSLTAACGGDGGNSDSAGSAALEDGGSSGETADASLTVPQWCVESARALCDWMYACFSDEDRQRVSDTFRVTEETCERGFTAMCQSRALISVSGGLQRYDDQAAATCVAALWTAPCGTFDEMAAEVAINPPECADVTVGLVSAGSACRISTDCAAERAACFEGLCTGARTAESYQTLCSDIAGADAKLCEESADCAADEYCQAGRCTPLSECPGLRCVELPSNSIDAVGICSATCRNDIDCGSGAGCFASEEQPPFCLSSCDAESRCPAPLSCVAMEDGRSACVPR